MRPEQKQRLALRSRLMELMKAWTRKTDKLAELKGKVAGFGSPAVMKPSLFNKLTKLVDQIALFRHKEEDIISEIDEIEKKHRFLRKHKKLKRAPFLARVEERHRRKPNNWFWWLLFLYLMFCQRKMTKKNQGPTAG